MKSQSVEHSQTIGESAGERERVITRLNDYMARTGLSREQFAHRINYSRRTLAQFYSNRYHHIAGTHVLFCRAIEDYIDANPIAPPQEFFGELYDTANVRVIRETIQSLLVGRPRAYMIYAPPGSEKTFAVKHEVARLNREEIAKNGHGRRAFYLYAEDQMRPTQLIKQIAIACGSSAVGDKVRIANNLAYDFRTRRVLLVIDEAQHLDKHCLEAARRLLDEPPHFSLLLAGSHDLHHTLDRLAETLEQLNSRIIKRVLLPGVTRAEARGITQREIGHLLPSGAKGEATVDLMIDGATIRDAYNGNKKYINIRTLTNSLDEFKDAKAQRAG